MPEHDAILRVAQVQERTGLARSSIYYLIQRGEFPPPLKLGRRASGWRESEIEEWISSRQPASAGEETATA